MPWLKIIVTLIFSLAQQACDSKKEKVMAPEDVALLFFTAIYVEGDIEKAQTVSGNDLSELLGHYRNVSAVKRHVVGMEMSNPEIQVKETSADFFRRLKEDVKVELHFVSKVDGKTYQDIRTVIVSQGLNGQWQIEKIKADPFVTNG